MERNELDTRAIKWGESVGILSQSYLIRQMNKMLEEAKELEEAVLEFEANSSTKTFNHVVMEMGDVQVTLALLSQFLGVDTRVGYRLALEKIEVRAQKKAGIMRDGYYIIDKEVKANE